MTAEVNAVPALGEVRTGPDGTSAIYCASGPRDATPWVLFNGEHRFVMRVVSAAVATWKVSGHLGYSTRTPHAAPGLEVEGLRVIRRGEPIPTDVDAVADRHGEIYLAREWAHVAEELSRAAGPLIEVPLRALTQRLATAAGLDVQEVAA